MSTEVHADVLPETAYDDWSRLVAASPDGSPYSTPQYLDALCRSAGGRFRVLAARHADELTGGVALYERDSPYGAYVAPRLLLYYNGVVLQHFDTRYPSEQTARHVRTMAALEEALARARYGAVELRSRSTVADVRPFVAKGWTVRPSYSYAVPLTDLKAQWNRVEHNLRRLIERCATQGLVVTEDDEFDAFYRLHAATMERHSVGAYLPRHAFAQYFELLRAVGLCRLFHARLRDGRVVASQLVLLGHRVSHTVSAAGDPAFSTMGAAAFLRWRVFETLAALGHGANDLTDATLNPVTHFKSQLGGELVLSLVVTSPGTRRYRWGTAGAALVWKARGLAGAGLRAVLGKRNR